MNIHRLTLQIKHPTIDIDCLLEVINNNLKSIEDKIHKEGKPLPKELRTDLNKIMIIQIIEDYNFEVNSLKR